MKPTYQLRTLLGRRTPVFLLYQRALLAVSQGCDITLVAIRAHG